MIIDGFCTCFGTFWGIFGHFGAFLAFSGIILACYACFKLQLEAGKALFRGLGRAKMPENVILGVSFGGEAACGFAGLTTRLWRCL